MASSDDEFEVSTQISTTQPDSTPLFYGTALATVAVPICKQLDVWYQGESLLTTRFRIILLIYFVIDLYHSVFEMSIEEHLALFVVITLIGAYILAFAYRNAASKMIIK